MEKKVEILDVLGGDVLIESQQYPINKLNLLTTIGNGGKKVYNRCTENIFRILKFHPNYKDKFRYDEWTQKMEILDKNKWREIDDNDYTPIQRNISAMYHPFRMIGKEMVIDAVSDYCRENSFDRAVNFIRKIPWDMTERLDSWLSVVYGVENDTYHKSVGANFFKGMVKRIIKPGCKFDTVMILEGKQGCGKSTSLSIIGGKWHLETTLRADNKDFFLQFKGKLIVEFSEGETMSRTETKNMKAMISTQVDTYRSPYGRTMKDVPRRCVFAMTTNQDEYLKDESGNRRFYPVEVKKDNVDLKWLKENRMQLFAEALYRVEILKESVYEYPAESVDHQDAKMVRSSFEDMISNWFNNPIGKNGSIINLDDGITVTEIWEYALQGDRSRIRKSEEMQISLALKQLGWERVRNRVSGVRCWRWYKDGKVGVQQLF